MDGVMADEQVSCRTTGRTLDKGGHTSAALGGLGYKAYRFDVELNLVTSVINFP